MTRYIDADAMISNVHVDDNTVGRIDGKRLREWIKAQPTADVSLVIHAHWIRWNEPKVALPVYKCSNCDFDITVDKYPNIDETGFWIEDFRYCLCCGAKMDDEVETDE